MTIYEELKNETIRLTDWFETLMTKASENKEIDIEWYNYGTESEAVSTIPYFIVAGWAEGYDTNYNDILFVKDNKALSVKLVPNYGYMGHTFDSLSMPVDKSGEVEYICMAIEREDEPEGLAEFFLSELERLMKEYHK